MTNLLKPLLTAFFFAVSFSVSALEIKGVKVDEFAQVGGTSLVLNGAGVRTKTIFKVYVAGLYLTQKSSDANAVINDAGNKRVSMHMLRGLTVEKLINALDEGFNANNSEADMIAIEQQLKVFRQMMISTKSVKDNDVILLDYTSAGTQISLNGMILGNVESAAFNRALLRVWLGAKPVDAALKKAMLGQ